MNKISWVWKDIYMEISVYAHCSFKYAIWQTKTNNLDGIVLIKFSLYVYITLILK